VIKRKVGIVAGLLFTVMVACSQQKALVSPAQQDKINALKELRDSGMITAQEYEAKVKALQPAAGTAAATGTQPVRFTKPASGTRHVEATDPQYQITAVSMDIPADWKYAGTIARPPGCHGHGPSLKFTAQSADGLTAIVALPGVTWSWTESEAANFLINIAVPNIHPGAKVLGVLPLEPEGQANLKEQLAKEIEQRANIGMPKAVNEKVSLEGARVRVQYERDGHPVEEMITAVVHCDETTRPALFKDPPYQNRTCFSRGTTIIRAPQGHLDEVLALPQIKNLSASIRPNPEWQSRAAADQEAAARQAMAENNRVAAANLEHFKQQGEQRLAAGRAFQEQQTERFNSAMTADRQKQAAIDASAQATVRYSLDRQQFTNPATGQVIEASNQYNHQWMSSDGSTLIQTNSPSYDPNGQVYPVSQGWTELVVK